MTKDLLAESIAATIKVNMGKAGNYEPYTGETIATLFNLDELYKLLTKKPVTKKNAS